MISVHCGYDVPHEGSRLLVSYGPSLLVNIGFDPKYKPDINAPPIPGIIDVEALVDTGAVESCIDTLLAAQLKLPIVDRRKVTGVHGAKEVNMHLAQVHVSALKFTVHGQFAGVPLVESGTRLQGPDWPYVPSTLPNGLRRHYGSRQDLSRLIKWRD